MVGVLGIEPSLHEPESCVLPVYDTPLFSNLIHCIILDLDIYLKPMKKGIDHIGVTVVYFCHDGKGNVLMAKRSANTRDEQGRWDIGGGGVEFGDTVEDTLRKKIKEEYNCDVIGF